MYTTISLQLSDVYCGTGPTAMRIWASSTGFTVRQKAVRFKSVCHFIALPEKETKSMTSGSDVEHEIKRNGVLCLGKDHLGCRLNGRF